MKNKLTKIIIMLIILTLFSVSTFASDKDKVSGTTDGQKVGEYLGKIWAERDRNNGLSENWKKRFDHEEKNITDLYTVNKPAIIYKTDFLDSFKDNFEKEYTKIYKDDFEKKDLSVLGVRHGAKLGKEQGIIDGTRDSENKSDKSEVPSTREIEKRYKLEDEKSKYSDSFIEAYKEAYKEEYEKAYKKQSGGGKHDTPQERGEKDGGEIGGKEGTSLGQQDYERARDMNSERALGEFIAQKSIESRYFLNDILPEYKDAFIKEFMKEFSANYNGAYTEYNKSVAVKNINTKRVHRFEETIKFEEERFEHENGSANSVTRIDGELFIPAGAIVEPTHIGLSRIERTFGQFNHKYVPTTNMYSISIRNNAGQINLREPLELKIPYYGSNRGAIYQLVKGEWRYLYSEQDDNFIKTVIPKGMYKGGQYAVFIDEAYVPVTDISRSWAKEELVSFMRRGYIQGDKNNKYYPQGEISRGEFLHLLGKASGWNYSASQNTKSFTDSDKFGRYANAINYAASKGYIGGYSDGSFRPNDKLTYNQIDWILAKAVTGGSLKWSHYEGTMIRDRFTTPSSRYNRNSPIKKSEAVYMLYDYQLKGFI